MSGIFFLVGGRGGLRGWVVGSLNVSKISGRKRHIMLDIKVATNRIKYIIVLCHPFVP